MAQIVKGDRSPTIVYDPFDDRPTRATVEFYVRNTGDQDCRVEATFDSPGNEAYRLATGAVDELHYQLKSRSGATLGNRTNTPDRLNLRLPAGDGGRPTRIVVRAEIRPAQIRPAGIYQSDVRIRLFNRAGGSTQVLDEQTRTLEFDVLSRAQLSLAGTSSGSFDSGRTYKAVDFGVLEEGKERRLYLKVRSNHRHQIKLRSDNRGHMAHTVYGTKYTVPYMLWVGDRRVSLDDTAIRLDRDRPRSDATTAVPIRIRIGEVRQVAAGEYTDVIRIEVTSGQ